MIGILLKSMAKSLTRKASADALHARSYVSFPSFRRKGQDERGVRMLSFYKRGGVNPPRAKPFPGRRAGRLWDEAMDGRLMAYGFEGKYSGLLGHSHRDCAAFFRPDCRSGRGRREKRQHFAQKAAVLFSESAAAFCGFMGRFSGKVGLLPQSRASSIRRTSSAVGRIRRMVPSLSKRICPPAVPVRRTSMLSSKGGACQK